MNDENRYRLDLDVAKFDGYHNGLLVALRGTGFNDDSRYISAVG